MACVSLIGNPIIRTYSLRPIVSIDFSSEGYTMTPEVDGAGKIKITIRDIEL